jgi:hypothetical protein
VRRTTKAFKAQQAREHDEEKLGGLWHNCASFGRMEAGIAL